MGRILILAALLAACGSDSANDDDDFAFGGNSNPLGDDGDGDGGGGAPGDDDDGDGFTNAEEDEAGTNPNYEYSHPYEGGYNVGNCPDKPEPTGPTKASSLDYEGTTYSYDAYQNGDVPPNITMVDQHGESVDLYSFCGQHVVLIVSAGWCAPCRAAAAALQSEQDLYWDDGVQFIELISQNNEGAMPNQAFLQSWASDYDYENIPVLGEASAPSTIEQYLEMPSMQFDLDGFIPTFYHLDRDMTVLSADGGVTSPGGWL